MSCWHDLVSFTLIVLNITLLYSSMAKSLHPLPINCSICGRSVHYQRVKSNKNGNQGQLLAKVSSASTLIFIHFLKTLQCVVHNQVTDKQCNFWHWCPDPCSTSTLTIARFWQPRANFKSSNGPSRDSLGGYSSCGQGHMLCSWL